jgi:hypothetical protein
VNRDTLLQIKLSYHDWLRSIGVTPVDYETDVRESLTRMAPEGAQAVDRGPGLRLRSVDAALREKAIEMIAPHRRNRRKPKT